MEATNVINARELIESMPGLLNARGKSYYKKRDHYNSHARLRYWTKMIEEGKQLTTKQTIRFMEAKMLAAQHPNNDKYSTQKLPRKKVEAAE